jgi:vitamin B12 transporter
MQYKKSFLVLTAISSALASFGAYADESLGEVVVTGRRTETRLEETPQRIEIINKVDIERTPSRELTDLLKKNSSVDVIQYPGNLSGVGIRGFRPEYSGLNQHTLLLIDGRPSMSTNMSLVNMDGVERIEVLKGPASALYGSSAMGGVINVISRESKGAIGGYGQLGYGSYDTKEAKAGVGGAINKYFDFDYYGSYVDQGHDFKMGNGETRPSTAYSQQSNALRIGANLNENWRLNLSTDVYAGRNIATPGNIAVGTTGQSNKDMDRSGTDLKLTGRQGNHRLMGRVFGGDQAYTTFTKTSATVADQPYLPYRSYSEELNWKGWQFQDTWAWSEQASFVFGVDDQEAKSVTKSYSKTGASTAPYTADSKLKTTGVYGENTWYFNDNNSTFYVGARRDSISLSTLDTPLKTGFTPSTSDFSNVSPSAGFKHLLGQGFRVHGTAGKGFNIPSAAYMTGSATAVSGGTTTITQGNSSLKPETSVTYDMGLEWSNNEIYTDLTFFKTKVSDKIVNSITKTNATTNLSTYINGSEAEMSGLEVTGRWKNTKYTQLSLSGTHYFSRVEMNGSNWTDVRNVPRNTVRAAIDAEYGPWSGRFGVRHVGEWKDNDWQGDTSQTIIYKGFTTADVSVRYRFDKKQSIIANIENLSDKFYAEKGGYPLPGRNGKIAYRYDF